MYLNTKFEIPPWQIKHKTEVSYSMYSAKSILYFGIAIDIVSKGQLFGSHLS